MSDKRAKHDRASPVMLSLAAPGAGHLALGYRRLGWFLLSYFVLQFIAILIGFAIVFFMELTDAQQFAYERELATGHAVSTFTDITIPAMLATFTAHPVFWIAMLVQFLGLTIFAAVDAGRRTPVRGQTR